MRKRKFSTSLSVPPHLRLSGSNIAAEETDTEIDESDATSSSLMSSEGKDVDEAVDEIAKILFKRPSSERNGKRKSEKLRKSDVLSHPASPMARLPKAERRMRARSVNAAAMSAQEQAALQTIRSAANKHHGDRSLSSDDMNNSVLEQEKQRLKERRIKEESEAEVAEEVRKDKEKRSEEKLRKKIERLKREKESLEMKMTELSEERQRKKADKRGKRASISPDSDLATRVVASVEGATNLTRGPPSEKKKVKPEKALLSPEHGKKRSRSHSVASSPVLPSLKGIADDVNNPASITSGRMSVAGGLNAALIQADTLEQQSDTDEHEIVRNKAIDRLMKVLLLLIIRKCVGS